MASVTAVKSSPPSRLLALDWLRGIAVLVMVECHVFNAFLAPSYREVGWFVFLNWNVAIASVSICFRRKQSRA